MAYNISNRVFEIDVLHEDCDSSNPVNGALGVLGEIVEGIDNGFKSVNTTFAIDATEIESSSVWTSSTDGGTIDCCVVLSLYLDTEKTILMHFLETVFEIQVDKTSDFEIIQVDTVRTGPTVEKQEIDFGEQLKAFICDGSYNELDSGTTFSQGNILEICVQVKDDDSLFEVDYVDQFNITQGDDQVIVVSEQDTFTYPSLTEVKCDNGSNQVCKVKFQLLGQFFDEPENDEELAPLIVSSLVKLGLKEGGRRLGEPAGLIRNGMIVAHERKLDVTGDEVGSIELRINLSGESTSDATIRGDILTYCAAAISGSALALW